MLAPDLFRLVLQSLRHSSLRWISTVNRYYQRLVHNFLTSRAQWLIRFDPYFVQLSISTVVDYLLRAHVRFEPCADLVRSTSARIHAYVDTFPSATFEAVYDAYVTTYEERIPNYVIPKFLKRDSTDLSIIEWDQSTHQPPYVKVVHDHALTMEGNLVSFNDDFVLPVLDFHLCCFGIGYRLVYVDLEGDVYHVRQMQALSPPQLLMREGRKVFCYHTFVMILTISNRLYLLERENDYPYLLEPTVLDIITLPTGTYTWKVIAVTPTYNHIYFFDGPTSYHDIVCGRLVDVLNLDQGQYHIRR